MGHSCVPTGAPVDHGDVAGIDVDADAVPRLGVSGPTDGVQTLEGTRQARSEEGTWTGSWEDQSADSRSQSPPPSQWLWGWRTAAISAERQQEDVPVSTPTSLQEPLSSILVGCCIGTFR